MHDVRVMSKGAVHRVVLKRWLDGPQGAENPLIDREALLLGCLEGSGLPVPRLVASSRPEETGGVPAPTKTTFVHGDYQHFNLLWSRGSLTGVVDWTLAGRGHPDRDVGHCRLNLGVLFTPEWASTFRDAYEEEADRRVDPWWENAAPERLSGSA